jgi:hypothetical protein
VHAANDVSRAPTAQAGCASMAAVALILHLLNNPVPCDQESHSACGGFSCTVDEGGVSAALDTSIVPLESLSEIIKFSICPFLIKLGRTHRNRHSIIVMISVAGIEGLVNHRLQRNIRRSHAPLSGSLTLVWIPRSAVAQGTASRPRAGGENALPWRPSREGLGLARSFPSYSSHRLRA